VFNAFIRSPGLINHDPVSGRHCSSRCSLVSYRRTSLRAHPVYTTVVIWWQKACFRHTLDYSDRYGVTCRGADKSLARPGRRKLGSMSGMRATSTTSRRELSSSFFLFFLQSKAPKEIHAILRETLACFLPGRAKDLSAPLYRWIENDTHFKVTGWYPLVLVIKVVDRQGKALWRCEVKEEGFELDFSDGGEGKVCKLLPQ
jgi:hypothetical protein